MCGSVSAHLACLAASSLACWCSDAAASLRTSNPHAAPNQFRLPAPATLLELGRPASRPHHLPLLHRVQPRQPRASPPATALPRPTTVTGLPTEQTRARRDRWALLGLCLAGFAWRVAGLGFQSLWRDEVDSLRFATRPLAELLRTFSKPGENGPLFFLALRPWLAAAGQSEFALRFPSAVAGALAIPLVYVLARRLMRIAAGNDAAPTGMAAANVPLVTALLVAINPYLTWYSQEGKMYAWLVVLVLCTHLAFLAAVGSSMNPSHAASRFGNWLRWLLYLALLALSVLTHALAVLVVAVHALWLLALMPASRRSWLPFALTLLAPALPYFALVGWWQLRLFFDPQFQTGHPVVPLTDMASVLLVGFSHGVAAPLNLLILSGLLFVSLVGLVFGARRIGNGDRWSGARLAAMLLIWLVVPLLALFAISLRKPLFTDRYLIWTLPALAMALALGVSALRHTWRPLGWIALGGLVSLGLLVGWRQAHVPIKADFRAAAAYVQAHRQPDDRLLFLIPHARYTFEYYAGQQTGWIDGPYTNSGNLPEQVADEMARALAGAPAVWLVASEVRLWDERGLVRGWLENNARPTDDAQFTRVQVLRYALPAPER